MAHKHKWETVLEEVMKDGTRLFTKECECGDVVYES